MGKKPNIKKTFKNLYNKADTWVKKNKPLLRKIDAGVDKGSKAAINAGQFLTTIAPATGEFAPAVATAGAGLSAGGMAVQGGRQIVRKAPSLFSKKNKNKGRTISELAKEGRGVVDNTNTVRDLYTGAAPPSGSNTVFV
jgi:hypothetical protein